MAGSLVLLVSIILGKPICCRCWGFGIPTLNRRIIVDSPPMDQLIHFIWQFLEPRDR